MRATRWVSSPITSCSSSTLPSSRPASSRSCWRSGRSTYEPWLPTFRPACRVAGWPSSCSWALCGDPRRVAHHAHNRAVAGPAARAAVYLRAPVHERIGSGDERTARVPCGRADSAVRSAGLPHRFSVHVLEAFLAPMIAAHTVSQLRAGVTFPFGQIVGPIGGFATIAVVAIWVIIAPTVSIETLLSCPYVYADVVFRSSYLLRA
jgi:hypothetical protein